jgi:uncharacterized protein (TIGR00369 family)
MLDPQRLAAILETSRRAPCIESLGFQLLEADVGFCRITARHDRRFDGLMPGFHGGMVANVADCVAWFAIATCTGPEELLVTTDMHVRYLNPCLGDVTATGRVIKLGKSLCPVVVEMFDSIGTLVAVAQVTYARLNNLATPREGT